MSLEDILTYLRVFSMTARIFLVNGKLALTQWKYALDMLQEIGLLGCKLKTSPMEVHLQFWDTSSPLLEDANRYRRLSNKLIYLNITRPDIVYAVSVLSHFI